MNDHRDDDFRIHPKAPKHRGEGFIAKVLKQTGKASSGKSSVRRSGLEKKTGQRPGSRLGRGHTAARFTGQSLTPPRHHQDLAGQPTPRQPAIARQTPALYRT